MCRTPVLMSGNRPGLQEQIVEMLRTMDLLKKDASEKDKALRTANEALRSSEKQAEEVTGIRRASCRRNDCVGRLMRLVSGGGAGEEGVDATEGASGFTRRRTGAAGAAQSAAGRCGSHKKGAGV